ncbi:S8 family serine peptidase [Alsobacter sp. R-9]
MENGSLMRSFVVLQAEADLLRLYETAPLADIYGAFVARLGGTLRQPVMQPVAAPSRSAVLPPGTPDPDQPRRDEALQGRRGPPLNAARASWERRRPFVSRLVLALDTDAATLAQLQDAAAAGRGGLVSAGVDVPVQAARPLVAGVSDEPFSVRTMAHARIGAAALSDPTRPGGALTGRTVNVALFDHGLDATRLPHFGGGWARPPRLPGTTEGGHGMDMARNVMALAPDATLHDFAVLPDRLLAIQGFASDIADAYAALLAEIDAGRTRGRPQPWVALNAWAVFRRAWDPGTGLDDPLHPLSLLIDEAASRGADLIFAAGNCGQFCPDPRCGPLDRGPGASILGSNGHPKVLTVASVRADGLWIGSSSQGPGLHTGAAEKPDISAPSAFREDDDGARLNTGTSTAAAVAAGALAALRQGWPAVPPADLKQALMETASPPADGSTGWSARTGHGVIDLAAVRTRLAALP